MLAKEKSARSNLLPVNRTHGMTGPLGSSSTSLIFSSAVFNNGVKVAGGSFWATAALGRAEKEGSVDLHNYIKIQLTFPIIFQTNNMVNGIHTILLFTTS